MKKIILNGLLLILSIQSAFAAETANNTMAQAQSQKSSWNMPKWVMSPKRIIQCLFWPKKYKCTIQEEKYARNWAGATTVAAIVAVAAAVGYKISMDKTRAQKERWAKAAREGALESARDAKKAAEYYLSQSSISIDQANDTINALNSSIFTLNDKFPKKSDDIANLYSELVKFRSNFTPKYLQAELSHLTERAQNTLNKSDSMPTDIPKLNTLAQDISSLTNHISNFLSQNASLLKKHYENESTDLNALNIKLYDLITFIKNIQSLPEMEGIKNYVHKQFRVLQNIGGGANPSNSMSQKDIQEARKEMFTEISLTLNPDEKQQLKKVLPDGITPMAEKILKMIFYPGNTVRDPEMRPILLNDLVRKLSSQL